MDTSGHRVLAATREKRFRKIDRGFGMEEQRAIEPGLYRHFKGNRYEVIGTALHSETEEELVVYRALYGSYGLWVRPAAMFREKVDRAKYPDVQQEYRFERIGDSPVEALGSACEADDGAEGAFAEGELVEAKRQIDSLLHKLRKTAETLEAKSEPARYKSQITLARRRIEAFEVARTLIDRAQR
ncbi:DUF1653 domain-containing protein [Slackia faecicanis]|nr:DUF1653 domain-containing protein [Slackia faecicanis]